MYELKKKFERYLQVNLLGPGPHLIKKEFTRPRSHKGWETLIYTGKWNTEFDIMWAGVVEIHSKDF